MSTEAQAIIDNARTAAMPQALALGTYWIVNTPHGVEHIDLTGDQHRDQPRRKKGTVNVRDAASFLAYYDKHASPTAEVYADRDRNTITAILDAHTAHGGQPEWQQHRVTLTLRHSDAFKAWQGISGNLLTQTQFAEFIEDHRADVHDPTAADLLELAQTFQATTKVSFKSSTMLKSGQRQLAYVEQIDAAGGQRGDLLIPDYLQLAIAVYEGATVADTVTARLRYRIDGEGRLRIGVILDQLTDVIATAFEGVISEIDAQVPVPVLRGTPA
ncbi:DUF2303 family protein [Micromonospora sp. NPDC048839]|uniref:DUF2303 family protein n=1 Tax=Micromonospora sp. NPDC048839 TaxID=3155641 RepID=UPI003400BCEB